MKTLILTLFATAAIAQTLAPGAVIGGGGVTMGVPPPAGSTPTLVTATVHQCATASSTVSCTYAGANTAGNTLIVGVVVSGTDYHTTLGITGAVNGAFTAAGRWYETPDTNSTYGIFYFPNCAAGIESITVQGIVGSAKVFLSEIAGANSVSPLDQVTAAPGDGFAGATITATIPSTASTSYLYGVGQLVNARLGQGAGWSVVNAGINGVPNIQYLDEYITGTQTTITFINNAPSTGGWAIVGASFKP